MNFLVGVWQATCFGGIIIAGSCYSAGHTAGQQETPSATVVSARDFGSDETFRFADDDVDGQPSGWISSVTGKKKGDPPRWQVIKAGDDVVLGQLESGGANGDYPVCLKKETAFQDGAVTVRFKSIAGKVDQAGGVIFRAKDKDNFYIARANALEDNVSFYVTVNGKRKTIKYWKNIKVELGQWHDLKVKADGATFKVWLNGKFVGEVVDEKNTFPDSGMVGVWTKADSVTHFKSLTMNRSDDEE